MNLVNFSVIQALEHNIKEECKKYDQFELKAAAEMTKLTNKINETNDIASKCNNVLTMEIIEKGSLNNKLNMEVESLKELLAKAQKEVEAFVKKLAQELSYKNKLEEDFQIQYGKFENLTTLFNSEIDSRNSIISHLESELKTLTKASDENSQGNNGLPINSSHEQDDVE